jgi:hypothetical protein
MQGTQTTMVYINDTARTGFGETSDELSEFAAEVEPGDYITVVYQTPSNGGSWHRAGGEIVRTRNFPTSSEVEGRLDDLWFEIETTDRDAAGDMAHFHINPDTGDYIFTDDVDAGTHWGVKKFAFTPE